MKQAQCILSLPPSTTLKPGQNVWKKNIWIPLKGNGSRKIKNEHQNLKYDWIYIEFISTRFDISQPEVNATRNMKMSSERGNFRRSPLLSLAPRLGKGMPNAQRGCGNLLCIVKWHHMSLILRLFFSVSSFSYAQAPSNPVVVEQVAAAVTGTSKNENSERELSSLFYGATVPGG